MDKSLQRIIKIIGILCIAYLCFLIFPSIKVCLVWILKILLPFFIGFVGAYLLVPLVEKITKLKVNYKASVIIVVTTFIVFITLVFMLVVPKTLTQFDFLFDNIPIYIENVSSFLNKISEKLTFLPDEFLPTPENIQHLLMNFGIKISNNYNKIFENIKYYALVLLISPILIIYFLFEFKTIKVKIKDYLFEKEKEELYQTLLQINKNMRSYINGVFIVMIALSLIATILFSFIGLDLSLLWGVIIGITNIIPYIGPYIGGAIVVIFTLATSTKKAISVLIIIIVLQLIESNLISPNIHSKSVKTSPILVLLFVSIFGEIMGIFGMIIAVPILSIFQILVNKIKILKI